MKQRLYQACTIVILIGFAMLIQPLSMTLFTLGLPVMIAGIVVHMILDHGPDRLVAGTPEDVAEVSKK